MPRRATHRTLLAGAVLIFMIGCAPAPESGAVAQSGVRGYPALLPLGNLLAAAEGGRLDATSGRDLPGRAAGLRARAARLAGPVISESTRRRLEAMRARHPA